jgi:hypothetical protein
MPAWHYCGWDYVQSDPFLSVFVLKLHCVMPWLQCLLRHWSGVIHFLADSGIDNMSLLPFCSTCLPACLGSALLHCFLWHFALKTWLCDMVNRLSLLHQVYLNFQRCACSYSKHGGLLKTSSQCLLLLSATQGFHYSYCCRVGLPAHLDYNLHSASFTHRGGGACRTSTL